MRLPWILRQHWNALEEARIAHSKLAAELQMTTALRKMQFLAHFTGAKVVGGPKLGQVEVWNCGVGAKCLPTKSED